MKFVIVDYRIHPSEEKALTDLGYNILRCPPCLELYEAICGHPDIQLSILDDNNIIVHKNMPKEFTKALTSINKKVHFSNSSLSSEYPSDIILNALNLKTHFIHNLKYTDINLTNLVKYKKQINVKQGYTKCSTAIINENAIMTSDIDISKNLLKENFDVLLLPPGDIILTGLNYGFIGGCCGLLDDSTLAIYGDLNYYKYGNLVLNFLKKHNVKPFYLRKGKLYDRGSLFFV